MKNDLIDISSKIRKKIIQVLLPGESHHIGCSLSIVEILIYLYYKEMLINPNNPKDKKRDIFILSKGHGALALYVVLESKGFFKDDLLFTYDRNGGTLPEHASIVAPGVELSTGSLGHGLPVALGFATSFINDKSSQRVFVLMSDGELNEGSNWEAIMFAGHHKLNNLIVVVDLNNFQGYGKTKEVIDLHPLDKKLNNFGWETFVIDGHNFNDLITVFEKIKKLRNNKPKIIFAKTIKGKGISLFENKIESHYKSLDEQTITDMLSEM